MAPLRNASTSLMPEETVLGCSAADAVSEQATKKNKKCLDIAVFFNEMKINENSTRGFQILCLKKLSEPGLMMIQMINGIGVNEAGSGSV